VLLVFGAPCQLRLLAGQEHGRTIPLSDIEISSHFHLFAARRTVQGWYGLVIARGTFSRAE
jgi:hypothetical protein